MRLIDADALLQATRRGKILYFDDTTTNGYTDVLLAVEVEHAPTIKVVSPVIHSKWISLNNSSHNYCENCGVGFNIHFYEKNDYRFCPYCGAKMDGGERSD